MKAIVGLLFIAWCAGIYFHVGGSSIHLLLVFALILMIAGVSRA